MSWCDEEDNFTKFWKERIERYAKTIDWKHYGEFWEQTIVRQIVEAWEKKNGIKNEYKEIEHYEKKYLVRWNLGVFGWNDVRSFDSMKEAKEFFDTVYNEGDQK